jgi:hypothetical protein
MRAFSRDVVGNLVERVADRKFRRNLSDGKPVALEASAEDRETRGFISMMRIVTVSGFTAN